MKSSKFMSKILNFNKKLGCLESSCVDHWRCWWCWTAFGNEIWTIEIENCDMGHKPRW